MNARELAGARMERQFLVNGADEARYEALYRDLQPGQNVYWNGFGQPPTLSFRAAFDDMEYNRQRQYDRELVKGRFAGGNLGWIVPEDMELYAALYRKPLSMPTETQLRLLTMIENGGPYTIHQLRDETGMKVKEITPVLHRLQEAFLVYEDQYDGDWERGWYRFGEMFPEFDPERYSRPEALKTVLKRLLYRMVWMDSAMAKGILRLPEKEIRAAFAAMAEAGETVGADGGWMLREDAGRTDWPEPVSSVCALHRNDCLYKAMEPELKRRTEDLCAGMEYDHELLQALLIDGEFGGAVVGHFRNGPYDLNDVVLWNEAAASRREEILEATARVNFGKKPERFMGSRI